MCQRLRLGYLFPPAPSPSLALLQSSSSSGHATNYCPHITTKQNNPVQSQSDHQSYQRFITGPRRRDLCSVSGKTSHIEPLLATLRKLPVHPITNSVHSENSRTTLVPVNIAKYLISCVSHNRPRPHTSGMNSQPSDTQTAPHTAQQSRSWKNAATICNTTRATEQAAKGLRCEDAETRTITTSHHRPRGRL